MMLSLASISMTQAYITPLSNTYTTRSFTHSQSYSRTSNTKQTQLHALTPDLIDHVTQSIHSTSSLLSDAAAAVAEDAAEGGDGWWDNYLNLYKTFLIFVHSTIDGPLKNVGWDQTWGVSIFAFTTCVRTALLPLSVQQTKSAEYIKVLKPYQDEIKVKYKDNKDMMNRATAKLYEDANTNPLSGCLVSILQFPILIGLYRSISLLAREGQLEEPFLWIPSLQGPVGPPDFRGLDWLLQGWTDSHPAMGWETTLAYLIMPIILVLGQSATMSILTPETDTSKMSDEEKEQVEKTQGILKFLPLLIGYFSIQVPAGLTIYWFTSNLYTVLQSVAVRGYYKANPPEIELPDYWDALDNVETMTPEEKRKAAEAGMAVGPKWEDIVDEANFHYVVERTPLREQSAAWERLSSKQGENLEIPVQMSAWVNSDGNESSSAKNDTIQEVATV